MSNYNFSHRPHEYVPFTSLGHGAQYHAYDMHDGRVLKVPLTEAETYNVAQQRRNTPGSGAAPHDTLSIRVQTFLNGKARIPGIVQHDFTDPKTWLALLGNPEIIPTDHILPEDTRERRWGAGRVVYTQDKASMNRYLLQRISELPQLDKGDIKQLKMLIEMYIEQMYALWGFGYSDYVFKIGDTGFDSHGSLFFVDLGEFSGDLNFMRRAVAEERWRHAIDMNKNDFPQIPTVLQDFYIKTMQHALTVEELEKRWRSKHICTSCSADDDIINTFIAAKVSEIDYIDRW